MERDCERKVGFGVFFVLLLISLTSLLSCGRSDPEDESEQNYLDSIKPEQIQKLSRDKIVGYAKSGVGSNYVWGGDQWDPANRTWGGADCSGYVGKAWAVPEYTNPKAKPRARYTTYSFYHERKLWSEIPREKAQAGDALVMRRDGEGHIVLFVERTSDGGYLFMEAKGVNYGIVATKRKTMLDGYIAITRKTLEEESLSASPSPTPSLSGSESSGQQEQQEPGTIPVVAVQGTPGSENTTVPSNTASGSYSVVEILSENGLNLRKGPSAEEDLIEAIPQGQKFVAFAKKGNWYNVWVDGRAGWLSAGVRGTYLKVSNVKDQKVVHISAKKALVTDADDAESEDSLATLLKDQYYVVFEMEGSSAIIFLANGFGKIEESAFQTN